MTQPLGRRRPVRYFRPVPDNSDNYLLYVPTGASDPNVDLSGISAEEQADFFNYLDSTGLSSVCRRLRTA
jgi:hypothetical protein